MANTPAPNKLPKPDTSVKTTLITVIGSIVVALLTTFAAIYGTNNGIKSNSDKLEALSDKAEALKKPSLPVGTVVASLLTPPEFAKETGDPDNFDITKSKWTLANGKSVSGTRWAALRDNAPVPDLCGVFLRGKKNGDRRDETKDVDEVALGDFRNDMVGPHNHTLSVSLGTLPGGGLAWDGGKPHSTGTDLIAPSPGPETRPKNVTVNYYIRIND